MPDRTLTGLAFEDLASRLGSRTRALAARRWLFAVRPVPSALPDAHSRRQHRGLGGDRAPSGAHCRRGGSPARREAPDGTTKHALDLAGATVETVLIPAGAAAPSASRARPAAPATAGSARRPRSASRASSPPGRSCCSTLVARARSRARRRRPATWSSWAWASRWTTSTRCWRRSACSPTSAAPQLSASHVTVSTSGVLPGMKRFLAREPRAPRAVAQRHHRRAARAADAAQPAWPIAALLGRAARGPGARLRPPLLHRVRAVGRASTTPTTTRGASSALLAGLPAHVNLIPHNPFAGSALAPPRTTRGSGRSSASSTTAGVRCLVRWPRGARDRRRLRSARPVRTRPSPATASDRAALDRVGRVYRVPTRSRISGGEWRTSPASRD